MFVYRCLSGKDDYFNHDVVFGKNTHHYDNEKYIHFFGFSQFCQYYFYYKNRIKKYYSYFMVADIPDNILDKYLGFGFYFFDDFSLGDNNILPVIEYAIPVSVFDSNYVVAIDKYIDSKYVSDDSLYEGYINLLSYYGNLFGYDFDKVTNYLESNNYKLSLKKN